MVGENLGSFRIEGTLGVGAMGVVYKAVHEPSGRPAAVKVVNKEIAQRGKTYERFQREAEILKQFRHPNIVRFLALGRFQGTSYIAMEFIQGTTLEHVLGERGPLPWQEVVELGIQVCDALHYAHEHGVVHRDLKPSNLMVSDDGRVKLTDFGIAKDLDKTALTATGRTLGTAAYMAPEQIRDTNLISHKTDLYALGVVLYQMLTGMPPFESTSPVALMHAHLNEPPPRPSVKLADIPKALDNLVVQLMAKSPTDRPWDAAAAGETLRKISQKLSRGEGVAMVWGDAKAADPSAPRAADAARKPKKSAKTKAGPSRSGWGSASIDPGQSRRRLLETAGLVGGLLLIGGVIAYLLWPPSMGYLYRHAERLMASRDRHDWYEARDTYLEALDRRFPDNPYKKTTAEWRDKIALSDVASRARMLESPANTKLNQPNDQIEQRYVEFFALVTAAQKRNDDLSAVADWEELARLMRLDDPAERPWHLLAESRAAELKALMAQRRESVMRLLTEVKVAELAGHRDKADAIRAEILRKYGGHTDLADLLGPPSPPAAPAHTPETSLGKSQSPPGSVPPGNQAP